MADRRGLGAISAATDLAFAEIMAIPELRSVVLRAVGETAAVARACGIGLSDAEQHEVLDKITSASGGGTGTSKSSMAADVGPRRKTEIDTIHGAVVRLGREQGVRTLTIDLMVGIVKGLESHYLKQG
jgi:2-dehydropantoate 2-reductase